MSAPPPRSSLLVRVATVTLSLGVLGVLVTQASASTGCTSADPAPAARPEPRPAARPLSPEPAPSPAAAAPTPSPNPAAPAPTEAPSEGEFDVGGPQFGGSKSGIMLAPRPKEKSPIEPAPNAPPSNANAPR